MLKKKSINLKIDENILKYIEKVARENGVSTNSFLSSVVEMLFMGRQVIDEKEKSLTW